MNNLKPSLILIMINFFVLVCVYPNTLEASQLQTENSHYTGKVNINKENKEEVPLEIDSDDMTLGIKKDSTDIRELGPSTDRVSVIDISPPMYSDGPDNSLRVSSKAQYESSDPSFKARFFYSDNPKTNSKGEV